MSSRRRRWRSVSSTARTPPADQLGFGPAGAHSRRIPGSNRRHTTGRSRSRSTPPVASLQRDRTHLLENLARRVAYLGLLFSGWLAVRMGGITLGDVFLIAAIGLAIADWISYPRRVVASPHLVGASLILLVFGAALSTANALRGSESIAVGMRVVLLAVILPWVFSRLFRTTEHIQLAATFLAASGAVVGLAMILESTTGVQLTSSDTFTSAGRLAGLTQHVSDAGGVTSLSLAIGLGLAVGAKSRRTRWANTALALLATVGLVLSGSVSGFIAVAAALLTLAVAGRIRPIAALVAAGGTGLALTWTDGIQTDIGALSPTERFIQTLGLNSGAYSSSESRMEVYRIAVDQAATSPFVGNGLDPQSAIVAGTGFAPHNLLIAALYMGGLAFLAGICLAIYASFAGSWLVAKSSGVASAVLAGSVGALVFSMTAPSLFNRYFWLPLALLAALKGRALLTQPSSEAHQDRDASDGSLMQTYSGRRPSNPRVQ